jgi:hypothetical protein
LWLAAAAAAAAAAVVQEALGLEILSALVHLLQ